MYYDPHFPGGDFKYRISSSPRLNCRKTEGLNLDQPEMSIHLNYLPIQKRVQLSLTVGWSQNKSEVHKWAQEIRSLPSTCHNIICFIHQVNIPTMWYKPACILPAYFLCDQEFIFLLIIFPSRNKQLTRVCLLL